MTTAIIGIGNIGGALARHLIRGGERFESYSPGGTRHCANQLRLSTAPLDIA